jgi:hypothetical protein
MPLEKISKSVMIILWVSTLVCSVLWATGFSLPFEPEPVTVILGLVSAAFTALMNEYANALEKEEYSVSYALAYGYVINFLEPVITEILKQTPAGERPAFYIYIPERLHELEPKSIDRTLIRLREKNLTTQSINLQLTEGRVRDVLFISKGNQNVYFDFPTTLLTLNSFILYKAEASKNSFGDEEKTKLGKAYIQEFQKTVSKMLDERALTEYISFVGKDLTFSLAQ